MQRYTFFLIQMLILRKKKLQLFYNLLIIKEKKSFEFFLSEP
jgi:hypothetical protein